MTAAEQITLDSYREDLARRARDHGASTALWNAEEWSTAAGLVLDELIDAGDPFTNEHIRQIVGPAPNSGAEGALLLRASRAGKIRCVGFARSKRPSRHAGTLRIWEAVGTP